MRGGVIGIDAGGTRTSCLVADDQGAVVGESRAGGANLQSIGAAGVEAVLRDLIARARRDAPRDLRPAAVCAGMAGADRPADAAAVREILLRLLAPDEHAPSERLPRCLVVNDALIALEAGLPRAPGAILISGTGSIAYARDAHGRAARAGGWGYVLGDEGSGYWLGRQALRSAVREADGRGPATRLTSLVLAHYGVNKAADLIREISAHGPNPSAIARLAYTVGEAAATGDAVAQALILEAASDLAATVESVLRRLEMQTATVLLAGGTLRGVAALREATAAAIERRLPAATSRLLEVEPALGAVSLARDLLQGHLTPLDLPRYV
jgi:N-acetylglucosamine kinase-like BadF-type ATPase